MKKHGSANGGSFSPFRATTTAPVRLVPKTTAGKAMVSRNAYRGGTRELLGELAKLLRF